MSIMTVVAIAIVTIAIGNVSGKTDENTNRQTPARNRARL
jgi:hypothetical protein